MLVLLGFLGLCAAIDFEEDRIPNVVCLLGGVSGFILGLYQEGIKGGIKRLIGILIILAILLPFWLWKVIGAGDVKLFMMTACYLGMDTWKMMLWSFFITGIHCVYLLVSRKNFMERMNAFRNYFHEMIQTGIKKPYPFERSSESQKRMEGVHVAYGALLGYMFFVLMQYSPWIYWLKYIKY